MDGAQRNFNMMAEKIDRMRCLRVLNLFILLYLENSKKKNIHTFNLFLIFCKVIITYFTKTNYHINSILLIYIKINFTFSQRTMIDI